MTIETITMIVVSVMGALVTGLFGVVAYFYVHTKGIDREEKIKLETNLKIQTDKLERNIEKQTDSLNALAKSVADLSYIIKSIKDHVDIKTTSVDRTLSEHWAEIELLRDSRHQMANWISAMRMQGEAKNGWTFRKDWELPQMGDMANKGHNS